MSEPHARLPALLSRKIIFSAALCLAACSDPVDKAAKARIFSPEDPPQAVAAASQKLPPEDVAEKPEVARRVLGMSAAEATERIGAHKFTAKITFEWNRPGKNTRLIEDRTLLAGPGGVSGDFFATQNNSSDQGFEVLRVHGDVYARSRYGKYRQRLRDRGMAERVRNETYGAIRDFDQLFRGRLKLTAAGTETVAGRTAWKYSVSLGPPMKEEPRVLPPLPVAKNGPDATTQKRLAFNELREPRVLQGAVWVDSETSVVLQTNLDGRLGVASDAGTADLWLVLKSSLSDIGVDPRLKAPAEFLPDQDKPLGIATALERFGVPRAGADGGTAGASGEAPAEEDEDPNRN
ncbi:MAG: hypothetical protein IPJ65_30140 [Archangiaceae bacterium]|nr:hypothetical protein [Archangiaceae bacterium]